MSRREISITLEGATDEIMPVVIEELADQILRGASQGSIIGGVEWSMQIRAKPVDIDIRQRRAAALLLMAVGERPILTEMAGSAQEASSICPGLTAADLPSMESEGRRDALRQARALIDEMLEERP